MQIAGALREAILSGSFGAGSLLPGENELAQRYAVSRGTIRRALEGLAEDRLIETRTGVGSFVTFDGTPLSDSSSWGTALATRGVRAKAEILRMEIVTDSDLAAEVGTDKDVFLALDRVRHVADGRAVSIERSRVPAVGALAIAPELGLIGGSLSRTMAAAGLVAQRGEQWVAVAALDAFDAAILGRSEGDLFLQSVRIAREKDGRFAEKVVSWLDPERFRLHTTFGQ